MSLTSLQPASYLEYHPQTAVDTKLQSPHGRKEAETLQDFLSAPRQKSGDATEAERKQTPSKQTETQSCRLLGRKRELWGCKEHEKLE